MPLILTFNGLAANAHTWYMNLDTGAQVQAYPGDTVPVRQVDDYAQYVASGVASISGTEDGSDGTFDDIVDGLRTLLADVSPVDGNDPSTWSFEEMVAHMEGVQGSDATSKDLWTEAQRPHVTVTSPANLATGVSVSVHPTITFDNALDPATVLVTNLVILDDVDAAVPCSLALDITQKIVTLTPTAPLDAASTYRLSVSGTGDGGTLKAATGVAFQNSTVTQATGFTTA